MGGIKTCSRYVTDITGLDPPFLVELGVGSNLEKLEKNEVFVTYERVIRS